MVPFFGDWSQSEKLSEIKPPFVEAFCAQKDYVPLVLIVNPQSAKAAGGEPTVNSFLKCINHKGNSIFSYFYVEMKA